MKFRRRLFLEPLESRDLLSCIPVTWIPQTGMAAMASEQAYAADKLVPLGSVTDVEIGGLWSDPHSWQSGHTPGAGAVIDVTGAAIYDLASSPSYKAIRVDGSFTVDNSKDESLLVENFVDEPTGSVTILEPNAAIHFTLTFADNGPLDTVADPKEMGRGYIAVGIMNPDGTMGAMAKTDIEGAAKTPFVTMQNAFGGTAAPAPIPQTWHIDIPATPLPAGTYTVKLHIKGSDISEVDGTFTVLVDGGTVTSLDITQVLPPAQPSASQQITVTQPITGWQVGDQLLLPGTVPSFDSTKYQDDVRTITAINGQTITLDRPLTYDHVAPAGQSVYVADLSRNIKIQSQTPGPQTGGQIMFMHTDAETLSYFEMDGLGRTDALKSLNNAVLDANGQLVAGTGTNDVGRYALHFHRLYNYDPSCLVTVTGTVVNGSPGVGIDNHSSDVNMSDNVVYKVVGQGIMAEAGDEIGLISHNFIAHEIGGPGDAGSNSPQTDRTAGKPGNGIWVTSAFGEGIEDNITIESPMSGTYVDGSRLGGLVQPGFGTTEMPAFLVPASYIYSGYKGRATIPLGSLPLADFVGNTSIADTIGIWQSWQSPVAGVHGAVKDFIAWNAITGAGMGFVDHMDFIHDTLLGSDQVAVKGFFFDRFDAGVAITKAYGTGDTYADMDVEHFDIGLMLSRLTDAPGQTVLHNAYLNNATNVWIGKEFNAGIRTIDGDVKFGSYDRLAGRTQYDYFMEPVAAGASDGFAFFSDYLKPTAVLLNTTDNPNSELWQANQAGNINPWTTANINATDLANLPPELTSLTNAQAQAAFGTAYLGQAAPSDAVALAYSDMLISHAIATPPNWSLNTYTRFFNTPDASLYVWTDLGTSVQNHFTTTVHLNHQGWNEVRVDHNGQSYGFLVYLSSGPATVTIAPNQVLTVAMADLAKPFVLNYTVNAGLFIQQNLHPTINLAALPIQTRADGVTKFVTVELKGVDKAGNLFDVFEDITVTP